MTEYSENSKVFIRTFYAVVLAIVAIVAAFTYLSRNYSMDDAFIYYRYIQNAIDGNGLVYNAGEKFYGATSALYMYISVATAYITNDVIANQKILSGAFFVVCCVFTLALMSGDKKLGYFSFVPALLIVSTKFFYLTFGMETTLYLMLVSLSLFLYIKKNYFWLGIVAALLFLTRGESIFLILTMLFFHVLQRKERIHWKVFIIPFALVLLNMLFNYNYYGEFMPQTFAAKMQQGDSGLWRSFPFLRVSHIILWGDKVIFPYANALFMVIYISFAALGAVYSFKISEAARILAVFLALNTMFYLALNIPGYPWYYAIYYYAGFIFFAYGLYAIYEFIKNKVAGSKYIPAFTTSALFLVFFFTLFYFSAVSLKDTNLNVEYKFAGEWLEANTSKEASVACVEIGHIGWYSKRHIIDILGLVTPLNAKFIGEKRFDEWLNHYSPDYIFTHYPVWTHEQSIAKLIENRTYIPCDDFSLEGFLMLKKNINN